MRTARESLKKTASFSMATVDAADLRPPMVDNPLKKEWTVETHDSAAEQLRNMKCNARRRVSRIAIVLAVVGLFWGSLVLWRWHENRSVTHVLQSKFGPAAALSTDLNRKDSRNEPLTSLLLKIFELKAGGHVKTLRLLSKGKDMGESEIRERLRDENGTVSILHPKFIEDVSCSVWKDAARGHVMFRVPEVVKGSVEYRAKRINGDWVITEFRLPGYRLRILRETDRDSGVVWTIEFNNKWVIWFHKTIANERGKWKPREKT